MKFHKITAALLFLSLTIQIAPANAATALDEIDECQYGKVSGQAFYRVKVHQKGHTNNNVSGPCVRVSLAEFRYKCNIVGYPGDAAFWFYPDKTCRHIPVGN